MINNKNIKIENGSTLEEIHQTILEAKSISTELLDKLSKIKIHINGGSNPEIINAIRSIFGDSYIYANGNSVITYSMYSSVINLLRTLGNNKAEEIL